MRNIIRWAIIIACCCGVGFGLAIIEGKYELLDFSVWLIGVMTVVMLVGAGMTWALLENDEEDESQEESQLTNKESE